MDKARKHYVAFEKRNEYHPFSLMFHYFMKRWPDFKVRKPQTLELARTKATPEKAVTAYLKELDNIMTKCDLKTKHLCVLIHIRTKGEAVTVKQA